MENIPITADLIHGAAEVEHTGSGLRPHRLPAVVRSRFPEPQLMAMERQPSGVRVAFRTTARQIALETRPSRVTYRNAGRPHGRIDVLVDGEPVLSEETAGGDTIDYDLATGGMTRREESAHLTRVPELPEGGKLVEFWLPHNEEVELLSLLIDAPVQPLGPDPRPLWVNYGSSISQGSNAASPSRIWPAVAARSRGLNLRNLGFGGSAMLDPVIARLIRDHPADLITLEVGINIVNGDVMRRRVFEAAVHGFLDTIREGHPDTPIQVISPLHCGIHERTPGPGAFDPASFGTGQVKFTATGEAGDTALGRLTLEVIRESLSEIIGARAAADPDLHLLDGRELYSAADAVELPLPDNLHPDAATHELIGARFAARMLTPAAG